MCIFLALYSCVIILHAQSNQSQYEGIFEYIEPYDGFAINWGDRYIYLFTNPEGALVGNAGTLSFKEDIVTSSNEYSNIPENIGTNFKWKSEILPGDTVKFYLLNDNDEVAATGMSKRIAAIDETTEDAIEGFWQYVSPNKGQAYNYRNHWIYLFETADGFHNFQAGTLEKEGNRYHNLIKFSSIPQNVGTSFQWSIEQMNGDTLKVVTYDNEGNRTGEGAAVRLKH